MSWEITIGFYPGIMIGFRTYPQDDRNNHVLYLPFIDICLTVLKNVNEPDKQRYFIRYYGAYEVCEVYT